MTRIFLCRHGQTEWNEKHIFQGQHNSPLTKLGIDQAKKLGEVLSRYQFDKVYCSVLDRARETANVILEEMNAKSLPIEYVSGIQEIYLGILEGNDFEVGMAKYPEIMGSFWEDTAGERDWETLGDVRRRAAKQIEEIRDNNEGKTILVVTHGVVLRSLYSYFHNFTLEESRCQPKPESACLCEVCWEHGIWDIKMWNSTDHLKGLASTAKHSFL
ncbi:MAG: histidine phosphatase family protein [Paludibacteraceae bacterium]|nr:histidine phosphatase family protein [Paludibacteraceae bacterium]